ncbi:hypothetical protein [Streptococcus sp. HF-1907]|nr:hypothetical protein [Streptococcus sp. HF-1907]
MTNKEGTYFSAFVNELTVHLLDHLPSGLVEWDHNQVCSQLS